MFEFPCDVIYRDGSRFRKRTFLKAMQVETFKKFMKADCLRQMYMEQAHGNFRIAKKMYQKNVLRHWLFEGMK